MNEILSATFVLMMVITPILIIITLVFVCTCSPYDKDNEWDKTWWGLLRLFTAVVITLMAVFIFTFILHVQFYEFN